MAHETLSVMEALDNLNALLEADSLEEIEITEDAHLIPHKGKPGLQQGREIYWIQAGPDDRTLSVIRETFHTVYRYLQASYRKMGNTGDPRRMIEGISTIMTLVGEAARKLDLFGKIFREKVSKSREFRELQQFYREKIIKESFREFTKIPLVEERKSVDEEQLALDKELKSLLSEEVIEEKKIHLLDDIEVVKRDTDYELFYLRSEDGSNFYTSELAKKIKLACDFGEYTEEFFSDDPLIQIKNWEDKSLQILATKILSKSRNMIEKFYRESKNFKGIEVVSLANKALMALVLAASPRNLIRQFSLKGCHRYFADFQKFLREILLLRDYHQLSVNSNSSSKPFAGPLVDLIYKLCRELFIEGAGEEEVRNAVKKLSSTDEKRRDAEKLSTFFSHSYQTMAEALKHHPNGPVFKAVDLIREEEERVFDPVLHGNIPHREGLLSIGDARMDWVRIPCPTGQEFIQRAFISEEFITFLRAFLHEGEGKHLLLIDFQDRTSWKEHARATVLEELSRQAEVADALTVITMTKESDFYNQRGEYKDLKNAKDFLSQFEEHLKDENTGYYFPSWIREELVVEFMPKLLSQIHQSYFEGKNQLTQKERLDFIEIAYLLIALKVIEIVSPDAFSFTSKDALDLEAVASVELIAFLGLNQKKKWSEAELDHLNFVLFGPTLLNRERIVHDFRFERLRTALAFLEEKAKKRGELLKPFASLYLKETLDCHFQNP